MTTPTAAMNKEHPLLFAQQFIPKLLDGTKTETRRPIKPQPGHRQRIARLNNDWMLYDEAQHPEEGVLFKMPYEVGDTIWVKETWNFYSRHRADYADYEFAAHYPYGVSQQYATLDREWRDRLLAYKPHKGKWRGSVVMPRWAARIFLEVTAIRIQRTLDVTDYESRLDGFSNRDEFRDYMEKRYGKDNHWLSATSFELVKP